MSYPPVGGQPPFGYPPPPPQKNRTPLIIALVAVVVVLVVGGVVAFLLLRDDDRSTAAPAAASTSATATSSSEPARMTASGAMASPTSRSPRTTTPRTTEPEPSTGLSDLEYQLYLVVPNAYLDCAHLDVPADGAVVAITCAVDTTAGPATASFYAYPDQSTASAVYQSDISGLQPLASDCYSGQGYTTFAQSNGQVADVACVTSSTGTPSIVWVDPLTAVEGIVTLDGGGGQAALGPFSDWWVTDEANLPNQ